MLIKRSFKFFIYIIAIFSGSAAYADTVVINAAGTLAKNIGPVMSVRINDKVIATKEIRNTKFADYTFTTPTLTPGTKLDIAFTNDTVFRSATVVQDRNLLVKSVKVNGEGLPIASAIYDRGAAGLPAISALDNTPYMPWNGSLRFVLSSGLTAQQMGLVINDNDPYSVAVGEYYRVRRNIPAKNIVHVKMPVVTTLTNAQFAPIKKQIDAALPKYVQGIALAWEKPYRVECNSITSALTLGFQGLCSSTCSLGNPSPYFSTLDRLPFTQRGVRPSMLLAARDTAGAKALIDRGIAATNMKPSGSAYIMKTSDSVRSMRATFYLNEYLGKVLSPYINVSIVNSNAITNTKDAMFYFQGLAKVPNLTSNVYPAGAMADTLTSFSGALDAPNGQMSILEFISAGATGSYGTVTEPCAYSAKFPDPTIAITYYTQGQTLLESYWKSVQYPFQGLFIGDPLSNPWQSIKNFKDIAKPTAPKISYASYTRIGISADGVVHISWMVSDDNVAVKTYKIYRNGKYLVTANSDKYYGMYTDRVTSNAPTTYVYNLTAVDIFGNESAKSAPVSVIANNK